MLLLLSLLLFMLMFTWVEICAHVAGDALFHAFIVGAESCSPSDVVEAECCLPFAVFSLFMFS
jgi:hypothetical protein